MNFLIFKTVLGFASDGLVSLFAVIIIGIIIGVVIVTIRYFIKRKRMELEVEEPLHKEFNIKKQNQEDNSLAKTEYIKTKEQTKSQKLQVEQRFLKSQQYIFIRQAVEELEDGKDIDYSVLKSQLKGYWEFSTNQLSKFISNEIDKQKIERQVHKDKSKTLEECFESFFTVFGRNASEVQIKFFTDLLLEKEVVDESNLEGLKNKLEQYKQIEQEELQQYKQIEQEELRIQKEQSKRKEKENRREEKRIKKEMLEKFRGSSDYNLVQQFAKKYGTKASGDDYYKLHTLISRKNWSISTKELENFVIIENKAQHFVNFKSKILGTKPQGEREILEAFLNYYRSDDYEMLMLLENVLSEENLFYQDLDELESELKFVESEIELKNFERKLAKGNNQISFEEVDLLNGYEFEAFLKNLFSKMGYQVEQTRLSGDQGADLVVVKFGEKSVIQAKRYGGKVGNKAVQEIMAAISLYEAQKGMVITNNYFTPATIELANANNIELIDRDALEELINRHW